MTNQVAELRYKRTERSMRGKVNSKKLNRLQREGKHYQRQGNLLQVII